MEVPVGIQCQASDVIQKRSGVVQPQQVGGNSPEDRVGVDSRGGVIGGNERTD